MHGIPRNVLLAVSPDCLAHETDTASPRTPVPLYAIHSLKRPFCQSPLCPCQRWRKAVARLFGDIAEGVSTVHDAQPLLATLHVQCLTFGHAWEPTEQPDVKACHLCHRRGYCPGCTPRAPRGAKPFHCTAHTRQSEVE